MADEPKFSTPHFDCYIWTKDTSGSQQRAAKTLGKEPPVSQLYFSPSIQLNGDPDPKPTIPLDEAFFFENKTYEIEFIFNDSLDLSRTQPKILHPLKKVEEAFHFSKRKKEPSLRASIETANNIGRFKLNLSYEAEGKSYLQAISFDVMPVKMDMESDLLEIYRTIDAEFPLWRYTLAEKTHSELETKRGRQPEFPLMWLAQFKKLKDDLTLGLKQVVNAPHSRLLTFVRILPLEKLRGKLTRKLEEAAGEAIATRNFNKHFRVDKKKLSVDTPENRFMKSIIAISILKISSIETAAKVSDEASRSPRLSNSFYDQLSIWKKDLTSIYRKPFFKEIGAFEGFSRESLVLQQKPGYAKVYKVWQQLKWHLSALDGKSELSQRNVADLYEIWCFLEVRRILIDDLHFEDTTDFKRQLQKTPLEVKLKDGEGGKFTFKSTGGIELSLSHEPIFRSSTAANARIRSWTTTQKPDILLEATFPNGIKAIWIFDAKYRIDSEGDEDLVPDDAINQMHRYRDSLIAVGKNNTGKSRPIIGAYALYPGKRNQTGVNPYAEEIKEIGIGAFCLLPDGNHNNSAWLSGFLKEKLGAPPYPAGHGEHLFVEEAPKIAYRGMTTYRHKDLCLVASSLGSGRTAAYVNAFTNGTASFYHTRASVISEGLALNAEYLAVAVSNGDNSKTITRFYSITKATLTSENSLTPAETGSTKVRTGAKIYWLFKLGTSVSLSTPLNIDGNPPFSIKGCSLRDVKQGTSWANLIETS